MILWLKSNFFTPPLKEFLSFKADNIVDIVYLFRKFVICYSKNSQCSVVNYCIYINLLAASAGLTAFFATFTFNGQNFQESFQYLIAILDLYFIF